MKRVIATICAALSLTACGGDNSIEQAFNPYTGTAEALKKWEDKGSLNGDSDYYGLKISKIEYAYDGAGIFTEMVAQVSAKESPEKMRKSLSKVCEISEDKFERAKDIIAGWARNEKVYCKYESSTASNLIIVSKKKKK